MSFSRNGGRYPFQDGVLGNERLGIVGVYMVSIPVHSVISSVAVTVHFLISLLFPVNWSYLNLRSLPVVPPVLLSSLLQRWGRGGGREEAASSLESLSGNTKLGNTIP